MTGLLDGMRVLDAGIWRPVPHATQMLADLGAEVLKIEPPGGDPMRTFPQLFRDVAGHKRSVELNLRTPEGRNRALELVAGADVFCEGWRPGVADRLGVGYDVVREARPSIIYCSVSGYGQTGPNVARPGHDVNYQALAGALAPRPGEAPGDPARPDRGSGRRLRRRVLHRGGLGQEVAHRRGRAHRYRDGRRGGVVVGDELGQRAGAAATNRPAVPPATACSRARTAVGSRSP